MVAAEHTVMIRRSPADVYAFLADGLNNARWRRSVRSVSHTSGDPGTVGAVYAQRLAGPGGREIDGDYEITEARPGEVLRFRVVAGPARPQGVFLLVPADDGATTVSFGLTFEPTGVMKLMGGLIHKTMQSEVNELDSLKAVLEGAPAG
ncbi:SRPBCC family protein [Sinomonas atrocyanea]|uniref:SRPBCC family protein n=1 Tax=Sinomonas atrocyanea TaxID=37927 RepID=UPI003D96106C